MKSYATSATVGPQGQLVVAGVPFAPGTEVTITVTPVPRPEDHATPADDAALAAARARMGELFRTVRGFRNTPRIPREALYERGSVR